MAFNEDKTITIQFRGDSTNLDNEVSNIDRMIRVLQYDTKALEKQMKFGGDFESQMDLYAKAISNVDQEIRLAYNGMYEWEDEVEKYSRILKENGDLTKEEWQHLNRAIKAHAEDAKKIENLKEQYNRLVFEKENYNRLSIAENLEKEGKQLKTLGDNISKVADAFKYMSLAAGAALTASTTAAVNFESAMANVNKVLRSEEKTYFDTLQQQILDMSRELPLTAEEIAQVTANALQLGISAKDVGKFAETILKLGSATNIASDEASIAIAQLFNITGEQMANVDKFGAALTNLGNKFPTFESSIMEMASRIAAAGSSVGMTTQDILGMATALASMGLNAESGGSAISTVLRNIDTLVATNSKKLKNWADQAGMSVQEFRNAWTTNVTGTFQTLINQIANSVEGGSNLNTIMSDLGITAIRQKDAFSRLVQANDILNSALYESADAWKAVAEGEEGALNEEFAEKVKTIAQQFQLLKNDLYALGVSIGQQIIPYLQKAIDFVRKLVEGFIELSPVAKKWITGLLAGIAMIYPTLKSLGLSIRGVGDLFLKLAGILKSKLIPSDLGGKAFTGLITAVQKLAVSIAGPVAIIGALVATFAELYKNSDSFRLAVDGIVDSLKGQLIARTGQLIAYMKELWEWLGNKLMPLFEQLKELYNTFIAPVLAYIYTAALKLIADVIDPLYQWVIIIVKALIDTLKPAIEIVIDVLKALATFITPLIAWLGELIGLIIELFNYVWNYLKPYVTDTLQQIGKIVEWLAGLASEFFGVVLEALQYAVDRLAELYAYLKDTGVVTRFGEAFSAIAGIFKTAFEWVKGIYDTMRKIAGDAPTLNEMVQNAGAGNSYAKGGSPTIILNTKNSFTSNNALESTTQQAAGNMIDMISNALGKQLDPRGW